MAAAAAAAGWAVEAEAQALSPAASGASAERRHTGRGFFLHRARLRVVQGKVDIEIEHAHGGVCAHGLGPVRGGELHARRRLVAGAEVELGGVVARASAAVIAAQDLALIASDGAPSESGGPSALDTLDAVARRLREAAAAGAGLGVCGGVRASGCWHRRLARRRPAG